MKKIFYILIFTVLSILSFSCKKPLVFSNENLSFSTDSVLFDTVFTTIGSTTKRFKLYNNDNSVIKIEEIELMGGVSSPFRINIDGTSGLSFKDIELAGGDSLFAFVEVTLAVNNVNNPLVISDSIRFKTNGKNQFVHLDVWGQDAYFHANELVSDANPWLNDKPHVLYGLVAVGYPDIDGVEVVNQTLTIPAGTQIYGHKSATLFVYKSTLIVNGVLGNEVVFQGDRLENFYEDISGQWRGIYLSEANNCLINYAEIKNGAIGIQVDTTSGSGLTLELKNTIITNNDFYNLFLVAGPLVNVENCLFGDAGIISAYSFAGGVFNFTNCNFVNYWSGSRQGPSFAIKTWFKNDANQILERDLSLNMYNSVMYGNAANEFVIDSIANSANLFAVDIINCLYKRETDYIYSYIVNSIWNENPLFNDVEIKDFKVGFGSPLIDAGNLTISTSLDIDGVVRTLPDIGVYEY